MFQNLSSILDDFGEDEFPAVSKQAISKARQGIKPSLFRELFNLSSDIFYANIENRKNWHNYHIFAIDGTKLQLPNCALFSETYLLHHLISYKPI